MKIAIDLSPLYSAHQYRGIGFYTKRLLEALQLEAKKQNFELELIKSIDKLRFLNVDLIHYSYFSPFFLSLPARWLGPSVVTIHDLIPVKYPRYFPAGVRGRLRWQIQKNRLKKVQAIITDFQAWRPQISQMTGFPLKKIYSVPLAAGREFKSLKSPVFSSLPKKFVLYVGDVYWSKNLPGLIRGFARFVNGFPDYQLVLVGKAFENKKLIQIKELKQMLKSFNLENKVKLLGFVETKDLVKIYNLASVYCQPSFDEGFGLGVLEAMACGCPVVAGNAGSLPEVCGGAAIMVNPQSEKMISEGLARALKQRSALIRKSLNQVKKFSWQKTAQQTITVYQKILNNGKN